MDVFVQLKSLRVKDIFYHIKDFIRSRPPLNPASRRKLAEKSCEKSTHTQLMEEIRSGSILKSVPEDLRPRPEQRALQVAKTDVKNETIQEKSKPKKVIRLSQVQLIESDSEEEDALSLKVGIKNAQTPFDTFSGQKAFSIQKAFSEKRDEEHNPLDTLKSVVRNQPSR